nr:eukaryotic translation initiation factor 2-alpha kinase 1 [Quercus suber]
MSKFFRSSSSASSDSSDSSSDELSGNETLQPQANESLQALLSTPSTVSPTSEGNVDHTNLLLHALLEERCLQQVQKDHPGRLLVDVESMAKAKFQHLCQQLASLGVVKDGLDHQHYASTRETYRSGLDMLMQSNIGSSSATSRSTISQSRRHLLTSASDESTNPTEIISRLPMDNGIWQQGSFLEHGLGSMPTASFLDLTMSIGTNDLREQSRYFRDFQEIDLLGKGGFGAVFHVKNRIDDGHYAIKKIPFSPSYLERIRLRGLKELDHLLREVRTLARLDHPNIVRYYAGWIEEAQFTGLPRDCVESLSRDGLEHMEEISPLDADDDLETLNKKSMSLQRVLTQSDSAGLDVVFETSTSWSRSRLSGSKNESTQSVSSSAQAQALDDAPLPSEPTKDLPVVAKYSAQTNYGWSSTSTTTHPMDNERLFRTPQRVITLCVQMSLHPFTLADFLRSHKRAHPTHCYHLHASIDILLAIMDGCEYLHQNNIVHRDLKPANILMGMKHRSPSPNKISSDGVSCQACLNAGEPPNPALDIRIGDFGLVTTLAHPDLDDPSSNRAVGTEIYRPTHASSNSSVALDVFALGIIAFEILWTNVFSTRSERYDTLNSLKAGIFPHDFSRRIGDESGCMENCIRSMLRLDGTRTLASLRARLESLRADVAP